MICPNCKTELPDSAAFCRNCGAKQTPAAPVAETPIVEAPVATPIITPVAPPAAEAPKTETPAAAPIPAPVRFAEPKYDFTPSTMIHLK